MTDAADTVDTTEAINAMIFDTVASLVIVIDHNGMIVRANKAAQQASGYTSEELIGRPFAELFIAPEHYKIAEASFYEMLQGRGGGRCEVAMIARDGSRRYIAWASNAVLGGDKIVGLPPGVPNIPFRWVVATGVDVTDRRAVEDDHRLQRELLQTIFDHIPVMLTFFDPTGKRKLVNRAWERALGWTFEEAMKIDLHSQIYPDPKVREKAMKVVQSGDGEWTQFPVRTRNGSFIETAWASIRLSDGSTIGICQDITDRKRDEDALRLSESRLRWMVDSNIIGVMFYHLDGSITGANDAFLRIVGYTRDDLERGRVRWDKMTPPEYAELDVRGVADLVSTNLCRPYEKEYFRKDGSRVPILIGGTAFDTHGREGVCFVLDLSERRAAEEATHLAQERLRLANTTLEQRVAERTAELTDANCALLESEAHFKDLARHNELLVREVQHRVLNNLAGLMGLVAAMSQRAGDVASFSSAIRSRLEAMVHIHRVLAESKWRAFDLERLVNSTLETLKHLSTHSIETSVAGPPVRLSSRYALPLTMVLIEWFTNSCKYGAHTAVGGRLNMRWEKLATVGDPPDDEVRFVWEERGGPPVKNPGGASVGTALVKGFVRNELRGRVELTYPAEGARHTIEFSTMLPNNVLRASITSPLRRER